MIELYLSKVTENSETEMAGKMYARVSYKQTMDLHDMAHHMAEHNTAFSEGLIVGVLTDFVKCVREMVLNGNTVKVGNLAIFKATVESNGLEVLYDAQSDKVASATIGTLKEGDKTGAAVKTIKLLAQSTGDFTREELKKDVKFSWTDKTKADIATAKGGGTGILRFGWQQWWPFNGRVRPLQTSPKGRLFLFFDDLGLVRGALVIVFCVKIDERCQSIGAGYGYDNTPIVGTITVGGTVYPNGITDNIVYEP